MDTLRVGHCPGVNGAHGHVFFLQFALLDQPAANRFVRVAVLVGIANAQLTAIVQLDPPRALDLQELQIHRIGQPRQYRSIQAVAVDGFSGVVRFEYTAFEATAQAFAFELGVNAVQVDHDQIRRYAVDRHIGRLGGLEAARVNGFVVTGDQAVTAAFGRAQAVDVEVGLQEVADFGHAGAGRQGRSVAAYRPPVGVGLETGAGAAP